MNCLILHLEGRENMNSIRYIVSAKCQYTIVHVIFMQYL